MQGIIYALRILKNIVYNCIKYKRYNMILLEGIRKVQIAHESS